jgi:hypothetical protein
MILIQIISKWRIKFLRQFITGTLREKGSPIESSTSLLIRLTSKWLDPGLILTASKMMISRKLKSRPLLSKIPRAVLEGSQIGSRLDILTKGNLISYGVVVIN